MTITPTSLPEVLHIQPAVYPDARGSFFELWHAERYKRHGIPVPFVQDNVASSQKHVLRGLHYQYPRAQAKLVTVLQGHIFDVAVDIRQTSPSFGQWVGVHLSADQHNQLFIPEGFAHGYLVLSESAQVHYKCSEYYDPQGGFSIRWDDPDLGIDWGVEKPLVSDKDAQAPRLSKATPLPE